MSFRQQEPAVFFTSALAILPPLAASIGRSTEQLAIHAGPRAGGLLNATFGNITELIISILLILRNEIQIVKASLTGSILGNLLLVLGMSLFVGGLRHDLQGFSSQTASVHTSSAVAGFLMPALFVLSSGRDTLLQREVVSGVVAGILILLYGAVLVFTFVTHQHMIQVPRSDEERHEVGALVHRGPADIDRPRRSRIGAARAIPRAGTGGPRTLPAVRRPHPRADHGQRGGAQLGGDVRHARPSRRDHRDHDRILAPDRVVRGARARLHQP